MNPTTPTRQASTDDLKTNYARGGAFGAALGVGQRQALLMIDFARAYFEPESPLYANTPEVAQTAAKLLAWARAKGILVCHTQVLYDEQGLNGGLFYRKIPALAALRVGSPLADFIDEVRPQAGEPVFVKQYASGFFGTSLSSLLQAQRIDSLIIAGMSTSGCVRASAVDAIQHGFIPLVAADACGDRHSQPHEANLFDLQAKYADVMTVAEIQERIQPQ